ncbi:hypothetical protein [Rhizobium sp. ICMP 5592]|uniref:hypothetical protein n=1 Tax=Rhizobium sp. ICMP 5592 TaxID=2292445 RepID=UPI001296CD14|nr:hypothetical protein [Rhizobium sp. ICMP 5592]
MSPDNQSNFRAPMMPAKRGAWLALFALPDRILPQNSPLADFDCDYPARGF